MAKPLASCRRIDRLKVIAFDCGFSNEDAKQFGKLSKTATWEALLETYGIPSQVVDTVDTVDSPVDNDLQSLDTSGWTNDGSSPVCSFTPKNSTNFLDWVDFGQLIALALASAGVFVLAKAKIILEVWGVSKGGSPKYKAAEAEYKRLAEGG
jgi:hypothetical protein